MIITELAQAVNRLRNGLVVAIPTETVYGLAADSSNEIAVKQIFSYKNRPQTNPLILHFHNSEAAFEQARLVPEAAKILATHFWPGPLTLVLPKKTHISDVITAAQDTVALRVPAHPLTRELLLNFPNGLVAPSANKYMQTSTTNATDVAKQFANDDVWILDGGSCSQGLESTIVAFKDNVPVVLRYGAITVQQITEVTKLEVLQNIPMQTVVPGMHKKHYAPKAQLIVTENPVQTLRALADKTVGFIGVNQEAAKLATAAFLYNPLDLQELATNLYRLFHQYDAQNLACIVVEKPENIGLGQTINDRLKRAATSI
ncbi:L-threonylcarbamoyladenylate synthase [Flavobacterium sp.]|uniref:L-threonylcarbamoyladenylate synthase n=1 Tax=Flavobacterium sp. TaxID=239 RepID=UPI003B995162